jgi:hypothetical protein
MLYMQQLKLKKYVTWYSKAVIMRGLKLSLIYIRRWPTKQAPRPHFLARNKARNVVFLVIQI